MPKYRVFICSRQLNDTDTYLITAVHLLGNGKHIVFRRLIEGAEEAALFHNVQVVKASSLMMDLKHSTGIFKQ